MEQDTKKEVSLYYKIFGSLATLTIITVAISYLNVGLVIAIILALLVAATKAGLVASFFMHLSHEKNQIYMILLCTVIFFAGMMGLIVFGYYDIFEGARDTNKDYKVEIAAHGGHHGKNFLQNESGEEHAQEAHH